MATAKLMALCGRALGAKPSGDWLNPWRFAVLLGLLLMSSFPRVVTGLTTFAQLDFGQFSYPLAFYFREAFWRGEVPLWNPLNNCGMPFLAQWNTMTLYPLSLFYLVFPLPWSLGVFGLVHLWLAGLGMYFLVRAWTGSGLAAAFAGTVFAFNGLTWFGLIWPQVLAALAWMPWVVLAIERAWQQGGRWLVVAAQVAGVQLLSGGAEVVALTCLVVGALLAEALWARTVPAGNLLGRTLAVGVLAGGLAAAQLLPFLDLVVHSQRNSSYGSSSLAVMPLAGLANYLLPLFGCSRTPQGLFVTPKFWTASYYLGIGTVALAVLAVWRAPNRRLWLLLGIAVTGLLLATGRNGRVYDWLAGLVPLLRLMRYPVKFVILPTFIVPLLAAYGLAWLSARPEPSWREECKRVIVLVASLIAIVALLVWLGWKFPAPNSEWSALAVNALVRVSLLVLILGCVIALCRRSDFRGQRLLQIGLLALLWLDVRTHNGNLNPTVPAALFEPDAIRQFYHWDDQVFAGGQRLMQSKLVYGTMLSISYPDLVQDIGGRRLTQFFNFNLLDHVPKFDGFYALDLKEFSELLQRVYYSTNRVPARLMDFLAIARINNATNLTDWIPRPTALPLITAGQQPVFAPDAAVLEAVLSDDFEPGRVVYLPQAAQTKIRARSPAKARVLPGPRLLPGHCEFEVEADSPAMVVVAQSFYHPWQAHVDGASTPLWRANYAFQALEIPLGKHQVTLIYQDKAFSTGLLLTALSLLGCLVGWFWPDKILRSGARHLANYTQGHN
jgi:hypothetical protein